AFAPVFFTACATVSKIGMPSKSVPPLPGVTPATIFVPYSLHALVWNWPVAPVMPCVTTFVCLSTRMLISSPVGERPPARGAPALAASARDSLRRSRTPHDLFRRVRHVLTRGDVEARFGEDLPPEIDVRALEPYDERHREADLLRGLDDSGR